MNPTNIFLSALMVLISANFLSAQMEIGGQTLYGDEWIDYGQSYYKIALDEDGVYRVSYQELQNAGVFNGANIPQGSEFKLYHNGMEVPIYISTNGTFGNNDFIEFFGKRNRGEIDKHLFLNENDPLNPEYSLFTDESIYFLTWNGNTGAAIQSVSNNITNPPTAESYCLYKDENIFSNKSIKGRDYGSSSWKCKYDEGEGFGTNFNNIHDITFSPSDVSSVGGAAKLNIRMYSGPGTHNFIANWNGNNIHSEDFSNYSIKDYNVDIPTASINAGSNTLHIEGMVSENDKYALAFTTLTYPKMFSFGGGDYVKFTLPSSTNGSRYMEINDFNTNSGAPFVLDLTHNTRLQATVDGSTIKVHLPNTSAGEIEIVIFSNNGIKTANSVTKRDFIQYDFANGAYDYIMVTHPTFYDDGNGNNYIQEYADYRASSQGGDYSPLVVDVTQLYDQFSYGVERHEMGIKNFLKRAELSWSPKLLYLIGKGVVYDKMRQDASNWQEFSFVPSYGFPTSDHLFVTPLDSPIESMGVGRLAIKNTNQLRLYLDKVKEYEEVQLTSGQTYEEKAWMKRVLHFGGGDETIQNIIKDRLNSLKDDLEASDMAADVISFFKDCTDVICEVDPDQVVPLINDGAGMLSFFGHSAPSTLDFDLGDPAEYQNKGKYPLFYAIGCNTNRIFEVESTLSEDFVFIEDKGCIGFFGATWITSLTNLSQYAEEFYDNLGNDKYGATLGEIIQETISDYSQNNSYTAELLRNALVLHGDPAVKLYPQEGPDYIVNENSSSIEPSIVNIQEDSFDLNLVITNLGRHVPDSMDIRLENELPNGTMIDMGTHRVESPYFESTYVFRLPIPRENSLGTNYIHVILDDGNEIAEAPMAAETNNRGQISYFVVANDIFPVYPTEFSIVSTNTPILKASTANTFSETLDYYFEIDTTELFDSPIKESNIINGSGGLLEWQPNIIMLDSTVYYWRVSIDSTVIAGSGFNWHNSSFIYLDGSPEGWNQSHYFQYIKDDYSNFEIEDASREQIYGNFEIEFLVNNGAFGTGGVNWEETNVFRGGFIEFAYYPCPGDGNNDKRLWAFSYRGDDLRIREDNPGDPPIHCFGGVQYISMKRADDPQQREEMIDFLENKVPDGDYVIFWTNQKTTNNYHANEWAADSTNAFGMNLFQYLSQQGASKIWDLETKQTPYILMYRKGDSDFPVTEVHADAIDSLITATSNFVGISTNGSMISTEIGPASSWETLLWDVSEYDPMTENVNVDIIGIDVNGNETLVMDSVTIFNQSLSSIDANLYPKIKLIYNSTDSLNRTSPQLDYWRVLYTPMPEAALVPNKEFTFHNDTLQQGETLQLTIGVENVGGVDMDSMLMHYTIVGADNNEVLVSDRMKPLLKDEMLIAELNYDTRNLFGLNRIIIEANPNNDQPELYHYNNIGIKEFFVEGDKRNPLLDVTFDGRRIMDGDIVSSQPEILISLWDENPYLALTDTSLLRVFLTDPNENVSEYFIDGTTLIFYPAEQGSVATENKARMEFRPELLVDGIYELEVRGKDASGNNSGDLSYRVQFEIINEEMVSNVLNYPNPFSTSTQFVFTLTGRELPEYMKIQIMTVSGKVVREITMDELGALRIGNNISDYKWDGTDEYGDKLANGVYLYRVLVKTDGEDYKKYDTGTNQFFKRDFGKMMILR